MFGKSVDADSLMLASWIVAFATIPKTIEKILKNQPSLCDPWESLINSMPKEAKQNIELMTIEILVTTKFLIIWLAFRYHP
jgi:hypothetical protein